MRRTPRLLPLTAAVQSGDTTLVRKLLGEGADPDERDDDVRSTPLSLAARDGNAAIVRALLAAGADAGARDVDGVRPLHYAAASGHAAVVRLLLKHGARVDARSRSRETALIVAVQRGAGTATVRALLAAGADANAMDASGRSVLALAVELGQSAEAALLRKAGAQEPDDDVFAIIRGGDAKRLESLLGRCADRAWRSPDGGTALHGAVRAHGLPAMAVLVAHGANPDEADRKGWTPLALSVRRKWLPGVVALLEAGADPDVLDREGRTALWWAAWLGLESIAQALMAKRATPTRHGKRSEPPLCAAARGGHVSIVELLLESAPPALRDLARAAASAAARDDVVRLLGGGPAPVAPAPASPVAGGGGGAPATQRFRAAIVWAVPRPYVVVPPGIARRLGKLPLRVRGTAQGIGPLDTLVVTDGNKALLELSSRALARAGVEEGDEIEVTIRPA